MCETMTIAPSRLAYPSAHLTLTPTSLPHRLLSSLFIYLFMFSRHSRPPPLLVPALPSPSFLLCSAAEGASHVSSQLITIIDDGPATVLRCSPALRCSATHTLSLTRGKCITTSGAAPARKKIRVITQQRDLEVRSVHYSLKL